MERGHGIQIALGLGLDDQGPQPGRRPPSPTLTTALVDPTQDMLPQFLSASVIEYLAFATQLSNINLGQFWGIGKEKG
jgi:hypothetical protein